MSFDFIKMRGGLPENLLSPPLREKEDVYSLVYLPLFYIKIEPAKIKEISDELSDLRTGRHRAFFRPEERKKPRRIQYRTDRQ
jgi:hypothetical protein